MVKKYNATIISLSIGIPAYNEAENIKNILQELIDQKGDSFVINKIIVNSDGSDDQTVEKVKEIVSDIVEVIDNKERKGVAKRQNELFACFDTEVLVLVNADIAIKDEFFLEKIAQTFINEKVDLLSCPHRTLESKTFIEKALSVGHTIRQESFMAYRNGRNLYSCNGTVRAFSKKFYKNLIFPASIGEDMYSYLECVKKGYSYQCLKENYIYIKLPDSIADHKKQSYRYLNSFDLMKKYFSLNFLQKEFSYPKYLLFKYFLKHFFKNPISLLIYIYILFSTRLFSYKKNQISDMWDISQSSKKLNR